MVKNFFGSFKFDTFGDNFQFCVKTKIFLMCDNATRKRGEKILDNDEKKMFIGLNIGYYRRARNLTQIELAESLDISSNYLSQIERGCKTLSLDKLLKMAEILGVDEKDFLDFSRKP